MRLPDGGVRIHAPAKLNLGLRVFPRRGDDYHEIESWMVPISLYDTLTLQPDSELKLTLTGRCAGISTDIQTNLAVRAATLLAADAGCKARGHILLHKVTPVGGGLGGGSSDGAAALLALNSFWRLENTVERLEAMALALGSDAPFFIRAISALCRGRGEWIQALPLRNRLYAVLFIPPTGIATRQVYEHFDSLPERRPSPDINWTALGDAGAKEINEIIDNDLAEPAFAAAPWLKELRDDLRQRTGRKIHVSGSGSTLFVVLDDPGETAQMAQSAGLDMANRCDTVAVRIYRPGEYPARAVS